MLKNKASDLLIGPHFVWLEVFDSVEVEMREDNAENIGVFFIGSQLCLFNFLLYLVFLILLGYKLVKLQANILLLRKLDDFFNNTTLTFQKLIRFQNSLLFLIFNGYEGQFMFINTSGVILLCS